MKTDPELGARTFMGVVMILLACVGIALIGHASDLPMAAFGYALMLFGVFYVFGLVRQHYDVLDQRKAPAEPANQLAAAAE